MSRLEGPAPALQIAVDMARRAIWFLPVVVALGAYWGINGVASAAYACAVVVVNFLLAAWLLAVTGRISFALMAGAAMFGYLLRPSPSRASSPHPRPPTRSTVPPPARPRNPTHQESQGAHVFAELKFPGIEEMVQWPAAFGEGTPFAFNKVALISLIAMAVPVIWFLVAGGSAKKSLVPRGAQNLAETSIEFIEKQVIGQAIGPDGLPYLPLLISMFLFIFVGNLFGIIPTSHFGANARMANPVLLAVLTWFVFIGVGLKHNGLGYLKASLFPPGVPKALYLLVTPIEFISTFLVRPFSLAVRLFANSLAGHILLVTFSVLTATLWSLSPLVVAAPFSFFMLIAFTGFELLVAFLQAYIFTLLTAVYIGGALHPHH